MADDEYKIVVRSLIGAVGVAVVFGALGFAASALGYTKFFGAIPLFAMGFFFGLVLGNKFFPDASKILTIRCRNYRRARKGKPPIDDDDPDSEYFNDIGRG